MVKRFVSHEETYSAGTGVRVLPIGFVEMLESIITVDHRDGHGRESVNITTHRDDILSCALAGVMHEALQTILRLRVTFED